MDPSIRGVEFDYCNLTCFGKIGLSYSYKENWKYDYQEPNMEYFGKYAIIIKDVDDFAKRLVKAINALGYYYNMGSVMYQ